MAPVKKNPSVIEYVTVKNTGTKPLFLFVGDTVKYSLGEGEGTEVAPESDGYIVKAHKTIIATIQYPSAELFEVTKQDTLSGGKFNTTISLKA